MQSELLSVEEEDDVEIMSTDEVKQEETDIVNDFNRFYEELIQPMIENSVSMSLTSVVTVNNEQSLKVKIRKDRLKRRIEENKNENISVDGIAQNASARMRNEIASAGSKRNKHVKYEVGALVGVLREARYRHAHVEKMTPCKIINIFPHDLFQVMTEFGILDRNQPASSLGYISPMYIQDRIAKIDNNIKINLKKTVSVLELSQLTGVEALTCRCPDNDDRCGSKTCKCRKKGYKCTSACHKGEPCTNKELAM
jgi:hypothetical protein